MAPMSLGYFALLVCINAKGGQRNEKLHLLSKNIGNVTFVSNDI